MGNKQKVKKIKTQINLSSIAIILFAVIITLLGILYAINKDSYKTIFNATGLNKKTQVKSDFSVHFIDVGQGDCSLIKCGDKNILIDTGDSVYSRKIINYLKSHNVNKIDYLIISHPHADHIGGLTEIAEEINISTIYMRDFDKADIPNDVNYKNIIKIIKDKKIKVKNPVSGEKLSINNTELTFFVPSYDADNLNNSSILTKIMYEGKSFLFTGDIEKKSEKELLLKNYDLKADVLKVAHHGSNTSSNDEFLKSVSPEYCVISCGSDNSFTHPSDDAIKRLSGYTKNILRTDLLSHIIFKTGDAGLTYKYRKE